MGVTQSACVSLRKMEKYTDEWYTVKRTSGDLQDGWRISSEPHCCGVTGGNGWVGGHANKSVDGWRVYMNIPVELEGYVDVTHAPVTHACGWRRQGTFFPTRIKDQDAEIKSWQDSLLVDLDNLQAAKAPKAEPKVEMASVVEAAVKADRAITDAKAMSSTGSETDFAKNLFMTVQGVKHDALCPHGLPYYACMSCSH